MGIVLFLMTFYGVGIFSGNSFYDPFIKGEVDYPIQARIVHYIPEAQKINYEYVYNGKEYIGTGKCVSLCAVGDVITVIISRNSPASTSYPNVLSPEAAREYKAESTPKFLYSAVPFSLLVATILFAMSFFRFSALRKYLQKP